MGTKKRISNFQVRAMAAVGLSQTAIARLLDCTPAAINYKYKKLGIKKEDARQAFMEDIILSLETKQQDWLVNKSMDTDIKSFLKELITEAYNNEYNDEPNS